MATFDWRTVDLNENDKQCMDVLAQYNYINGVAGHGSRGVVFRAYTETPDAHKGIVIKIMAKRQKICEKLKWHVR
jgi:hypothetical protein